MKLVEATWEQRNLGIVACRGNSDRLLGERRTAERIVALPSPDGTVPQGTLRPQIPERLAAMLKMSARYMWSGSSDFSPRRKAAVGEVGEAITSTSAKARVKSFRIKVRIFWART